MLIVVFDAGGLKGKVLSYGSFKVYSGETLLDHIRYDYGYDETNNEAEYRITLDMLKYINKKYNDREITIYNDSELVRNQVGVYQNGEWIGWKCNYEHLKVYRDAIRGILEEYTFTWEHKPRRFIVSHLGH